MTGHRILGVLVAAITIAGTSSAQSRDDSVAVTNAFVRLVVEQHATEIVVDSGRTPWGAYAATVLQAALPHGGTPLTDSARYYALHLLLESVHIGAKRATVRVTWSRCGAEPGMNWWTDPTEYYLVRADSGWVVIDKQVLEFDDGHCHAFQPLSGIAR